MTRQEKKLINKALDALNDLAKIEEGYKRGYAMGFIDGKLAGLDRAKEIRREVMEQKQEKEL